MAALELRSIVKDFGTVSVIRDIDLNVGAGQFVVFVGPSGCGKSTLLRIIAGLETPTSGEVLIDGVDVTHVPAADRGLAMVFQSYALYPHMSVYKNMAFALENLGVNRAEIEMRVRRAAQMLRLTDYLDRKPRALSGGQRQRVAIGRAIVRDPKIFLFDEPLSNLDAELRVATRKELADLHAGVGATMIYVTHDQVEAMTLADRIVVLNAGRIEQVGTPLELYNRPMNLFVAGFIGSPRMNLLPATLAEGAARIDDATITLPDATDAAPGASVTLGIRPEHVRISAAPDLAVRVEFVERLGGETFAYGTTTGGLKLTVRQDGQSSTHRGDTLHVALPKERLHVFDSAGLAISSAAPTGNGR